MSNSKSKYDWDIHLPNMISLYFMGMSVPDICKSIQDEATGFTPGLSIIYQKLRSEGYPTEKNQRARVLKAHELSKQLDFGSSAGISGHRPTHPASFSQHQNHDNYDIGVYPSTSNLVAQQTSMASGTVDPSMLEYSHTCNVSRAVGPSDSFKVQNEFGFANVSSGLNFDASSGIFPHWKAVLPLVQRPDGFGVDPNTFTDVTEPAQVARNPTADSASFGNQEWFNNSTPPPGCHGQDQSPLSREQDGLTDHQNYGSCTTIEDHHTPQLPLVTETNDGVGEDSLEEIASIPQRSSTGAETQPDIISTNFSEDHDISMSAPADDDDVITSTVANPTDMNPDTYIIQNHSLTLGSRNTPSPIDNSSPGGRVVSWIHPKARYLLTRAINLGQKRDSGYASGRNSPMTPLVEEIQPDPLSLLEFKGLYRVSCQRLHEPKPIDTLYIPESKAMKRFKETPTCSQCLYSSIHNLSWSARYLGLAVFEAELKLDSKYDITALDKVGNSALHYAAAGGAGFEHFHALIHAGVKPYQINTAGQLFLHCLRPHMREICSEGFDDKLIAGFHTDLIDLLNTFQPKRAFRWRDNEGRTVLDALASNIINTEIRTRTFRRVQDAGYPLEVSNQYPTRKSSRSQPNKPSPTKDGNFAVTQDRQKEAYDILGRASMEPSYIDPDTGDNVLHALARLKPGGSLISKIQEFVSKDIDLNLHNRNRDCPLAAFISERPFLGQHNDETGATMSKYLDALLWSTRSDAHHRIPNRINVNMCNRDGVTALYYAAIRARPDSVRSLIEAGANVNARQEVDGHKISILQATMNAKARAVHDKDDMKVKDFKNVISYLEHENAVAEPSLSEERAVCKNSVRIMPM